MNGRRLLLVIILLTLLAACSDPAQIATGEEPAQPDAIALTDESDASVDLRLVVEAAIDGELENGWHRSSLDFASLEPDDPSVQLALVSGSFYDSGEIMILAVLPLGACESECVEVASQYAEQASDASYQEAETGTSVDAPNLLMLYVDPCDNCDSQFVSMIEVVDEAPQSIGTSRVRQLLGPVDTEAEVFIVFGEHWLVRSTESGWEMIVSRQPACSDESASYTLSSMTSGGAVRQIDTHIRPGSPDDVVCD